MSATITSQDAQYAIDIVESICTQVGPGFPGSSQERARAAVVKIESGYGLDEAQLPVSPGAEPAAAPI